MLKIKVKNLGNIKSGYQENDGFMEITKVTLFTGQHGNKEIYKLILKFLFLDYRYRQNEKTDIILPNFDNWYLIDCTPCSETTELIAIMNNFKFEFIDRQLKLRSLTEKSKFISLIDQNKVFDGKIIAINIEEGLSVKEQVKKLYQKLEEVNNSDNLFIFTTDSPYILNALTLAIKAKGIKNQNIVPKNSCLKIEDVSIYELIEDGIIHKLPIVDGLPSDNNYLNNQLAKSNELFDQLVELENLSS
jgi:hypothetical protein